MIKTLTCAMVAAAAVALSASTSNADVVVVTNFDTVTLSLTIRTNVDRVTGPSTVTRTAASSRFVTKDLLNLLSGPDFAGTSLSNDTLAISWDLSTVGDHLVVIDSQKRVVYDVTGNDTTNSNVTINFGFLLGATSGTANVATGSENTTALNTGFFTIRDGTGTNTVIDLFGWGPSTVRLNSRANTNGVVTSWSHSATFTPQGANQIFRGAFGDATTTGTISSRGSGNTPPYQLDIGSLGE